MARRAPLVGIGLGAVLGEGVDLRGAVQLAHSPLGVGRFLRGEVGSRLLGHVLTELLDHIPGGAGRGLPLLDGFRVRRR